MFFEQKYYPAVDKNGKMMLSEKHKIIEFPVGNGAMIRNLVEDGMLHGRSEVYVRLVDRCFFLQFVFLFVFRGDAAAFIKKVGGNLMMFFQGRAHTMEFIAINCHLVAIHGQQMASYTH